MTRRPNVIAAALLGALFAGAWGCSVYDPELVTNANGQSGAGRAGTDGSQNAGVGGGHNDCETECTRPNADAACVQGHCLIANCRSPYVDCDSNPDNGCEATLDTLDNCGLCGAACKFNHAAASCSGGHCSLGACDRGFSDCDENRDNGCETALDNLSNCGTCKQTCRLEHAVASCEALSCSVNSCARGFGDCNGDAKDGCEQSFDDPEHCGACDAHCTAANASASKCISGSCVVGTCSGTFADCNGLGNDGCEASVESPSHCGGCGKKCSLPHVAHTTCSTVSGKQLCGIDTSCPTEAANCVAGGESTGCVVGFADCDHNPMNGCETDLTRLSNCGRCGNNCVVPDTVRVCENGSCITKGCLPGYALCGGEVCLPLRDDVNNCGTCGNKCSGDTPYCAGGKCTGQQCAANTADCDGRSGNACETDLKSANNCGGCGSTCPRAPHSTPSCKDGACTIGNCDSGFDDCDHDPSNGCEVDLHTANDCGGCGVPCALPNAVSDCPQGQCVLRDCEADRANCNGMDADGCETDLKLPTSCGGCNNTCGAQQPNVVSSSCVEGACKLVCQPGRADCDKRPDTGCEGDLNAAHSCGACNNDCTRLSHVSSAVCSEGACTKLVCDADYADCNADPRDGCERSLRSATDCGTCNQACAPAHAKGSCGAGGQCQIGSCDPGFGNCDKNPSNGCEAPLSTPEHCGACGTVCAAGTACINGQCSCGGNAECTSDQTCCDGKCVSIAGQCFPFPCIPPTDLSANKRHCGACGTDCGVLWCCAVLD